MSPPQTTSPSSAALISVGGSPEPVLLVLRQHRPAHVWYFCSAASRANADAIQARLDWHPQARFIEVERFEELGPCYRELRRKIPELLSETRVQHGEVLVDYTGGTKTMSAALVLAATELFDRFSYVGGAQREKGGLGVTVDGKERVLYQGNPWSQLAIREIERARDLWAGHQFEGVARVLREVAPRVSHRLRFEAIADLAEAMAARHRLDFRTAFTVLSRLVGRLPALFDGRDNFGLIRFAREVREICEACSKDIASVTFLCELLDNALRTAAQGRFEDAAARLYRVMEMQGQLWLSEMTDGSFTNGRCKAADMAKLPATLTSLDFCRPDERGEIKLSLEQIFLALAALGHERAKAVTLDLALERKSRWRAATEKRNTSILAHGVLPIGREGFEQMKTLTLDFFQFDLARESNPIPPLDPRWLE